MEDDCRAVQITEDMRFAGWIIRATDTKSEFVILTDFLRQQCLHERASCYVTLILRVVLTFHTTRRLPLMIAS